MTIYSTRGTFTCYGTLHIKDGIVTFVAYGEKLETKEIPVIEILQIED